ncbi:hypothetical protein [Shewanella xiamenensis]|uniref:hypothetical protein n=1 Tax=Shewanella xiamenensis TaxID=332186 RepID=UPI0004D619FE|nr:hypothetical protein [Shewanella xiamenensis]KEK29566.1 hypothetical protein SXM_0776 [Shewanella xiamenensis]
MSVIGIYNEPQDIFFKLLREGRRTWISQEDQEKYDSLCNFCVTAHSLRDWCIKYLAITSDADKNAFHNEMNLLKYFPECRDIANSSKHFGLSSKASLVASATTTNSMFAVITGEQNQQNHEMVERKDISITLSDNSSVDLFGFLYHVATNWTNVLNNKSIPLNPGLQTVYMFIENR